MADREHPKTHVEDQDLKGLRKQPLSPQHEGIDPLTESDTMLPRNEGGAKSEKTEAKEAQAAADKQADTLQDQKHVESDDRPADEVNEDKAADEATEAEGSGEESPAEEPTVDPKDTKPGKADDPTPDAGEKAEDQEPHTDKGNTSPANRTKSK